MTEGSYSIRTMTRREVDLAVDWAAAEAWNPGLSDANCYHTADPKGFKVGLLNSEPIASISCVRYGEGFGFIGLYIVTPEYRGQGYGVPLWNAAMDFLDGRNIGLDGVPEQQENYRKFGFRLAYRNVRYEGRGGGAAVPLTGEVVPLRDVPFQSLLAYEHPFFPEPRPAFLEAWISQPGSIAVGLLGGRSLAGYGVCRPCRRGYKIGPLAADSPEQASGLLDALTNGIDRDTPVYLDVPAPNEAAVKIAEERGMEVVFETARMYTGEFPSTPLDRLYGVTSFEVG